MLRYCRRHWILSSMAMLVVLGVVWVRYRMWGPDRDYRVDLAIRSGGDSGRGGLPLEVGVARRDITPDLARYDPWTDADHNGRFETGQGDRFEDRNGNGTFDLVWLGGFRANRPAQGVNDPLWTRAIAFRQGPVTVVMVTIDSVGITHERFIKVRKSIDHARYGITHILFSSTHTHNAPDTMGIWSYRPILSKFDGAYLDLVLDKTREVILEAVGGLQPAQGIGVMMDMAPAGLVKDSRKPEVFDRKLCAARFVKAGTDETLAVLMSWGNHPEAFGGDNPLVSSDYPHYWRVGVEEGLAGENGAPGTGGMSLFFQGPLGGLMTPLGLEVPDRSGAGVHRTNGVGKAKALGENLALRTLAALRGAEAKPFRSTEVAVVARTVFAPIEGTFRIPIMLGLIHPGWFGGKARTEMDAVRVGDLEILTIPGELYPEISEGGIESPEGADHPGQPVEVPPLRSQMRGRVNMVFNLANDEVGYIIPRTEWDAASPHAYGLKKAPYGEVNSGGPDVAGVVHREGLAVLRRLHELMGEADGDSSPAAGRR